MIAVIDPRMPCSAKEKLKSICEVVELPPFSALDPRVASHPDMLMFVTDSTLFVSSDYYNEAKAEIDSIINATSLSLVLTKDSFGNKYPNDIKFNCFILNKALVGNAAHISSKIKSNTEASRKRIVNVKQGYAKCSTVVLEGAVITADKGIYEAAASIGADALLVSAEGVALNGYDCGFIGGASGVFENQVFFCGNANAHKDFERISAFCAMKGYRIISLSDEPLYDVGTILFFD